MKNGIVVVGSSNTDMVIRSDHFPAPGETILGGSFFLNPGGKGANQAVAAARTGGRVSFICQTGNDVFGQQARDRFTAEGIDISCAGISEGVASGVALITVDPKGENTIVVASGANALLLPGQIDKARQVISSAAILLLQLETPLETVVHAASVARQAGVKVVLNPAPVCDIPAALFRLVDIITPNENEAEKLSGVPVRDKDSAETAARIIHERGIPTVIITRGKEGALIFHNGTFVGVPACTVTAIDTTAAGDVFNGALTVALSEGKDLAAAARFASAAAAISVTRAGAQSSVPFRHEVDNFQPHPENEPVQNG